MSQYTIKDVSKNKKNRTPELQNEKIRNKQNFEWKISQNTFRKHQIQKKFPKILWKKSSQKYFCGKKNFRKKKFDNQNFYQKNVSKKKNSRQIKNIILAIFLYLKKSSVGTRLIFEKKKSKKFWK